MKCVFGIVGSGWRSEFYLRIAKELPGLFEISGLVTTNPEKAGRFENIFGVKVFGSFGELLDSSECDFVVVSIPARAAMPVSLELLRRGLPVLLETPPADTVENLIRFWRELPSGAKIQVAEQYFLHPLHQARLAVAESGKLGTVNEVQVSFSHGYHGVSLIRKYLGIGFENAQITARKFILPCAEGFSREGYPKRESIVGQAKTIASLDFGGKIGVYDFAADQHRSWVRSPRIIVRGERGEIYDDRIKYLRNFITPAETRFLRKNVGENENVEGYGLKGIMAEGEWVYKNPFPSARLIDDEIAVASCLVKMAEYVRGGEPFYSLAEASQDHYLGTLINQAASDERDVFSESMPWSGAGSELCQLK